MKKEIHAMTVKELKELLEGLDDSMIVLKTDGDYYPQVGKAEVTEMYKIPRYASRRGYMTAKRWFGVEDYRENPDVFEALLID